MDKEKSDKFITKVTEFRTSNGISLSELARRANISKAYLHQLETRKSTKLSLEIAIRLSKICFIKLDNL